MYSEVLDIIASYETGFADCLREEYQRLNRKLSSSETDRLFKNLKVRSYGSRYEKKHELKWQVVIYVSVMHYIRI